MFVLPKRVCSCDSSLPIWLVSLVSSLAAVVSLFTAVVVAEPEDLSVVEVEGESVVDVPTGAVTGGPVWTVVGGCAASAVPHAARAKATPAAETIFAIRSLPTEPPPSRRGQSALCWMIRSSYKQSADKWATTVRSRARPENARRGERHPSHVPPEMCRCLDVCGARWPGDAEARWEAGRGVQVTDERAHTEQGSVRTLMRLPRLRPEAADATPGEHPRAGEETNWEPSNARGPTRRRTEILTYASGVFGIFELWVLGRTHVVSERPLWLLLAVLAGAAGAGWAGDSVYRAHPSTKSLHLRVACQTVSVTAIIYLVGWGPALAIGFAFPLLNTSFFVGPRGRWALALWPVLCLAAGQLAVDLGYGLFSSPTRPRMGSRWSTCSRFCSCGSRSVS